MGVDCSSLIPLHCDDQSTIKIATNLVFLTRKTHWDWLPLCTSILFRYQEDYITICIHSCTFAVVYFLFL